MIGFTLVHWAVLGFIGLLFLVAFFYSLKLRGQTQAVALIVLVLVSVMLSFVSMISLDKSTKKATLTKIENRRILRTEEIMFTGYVVNTGSYTIGESILEIKLINHGKASGRIKGTDFYRTNSFFGNLFSSSSDKKKSRPSSLTYKFKIAQGLEAGKRKRFSVRFKFPSYFKDVDFRMRLHSDYTSKTIRMN